MLDQLALFASPAAAAPPPQATAVLRAAELSPCGRYRFVLCRSWGAPAAPVVFVMLNPSTADAEVDDPTTTRCIGFARELGATSLQLVNLFAFRATDPADLWAYPSIGLNNDDYILAAARKASTVICAWGAFAGCPKDRAGSVRARARRVSAMLVSAGVQLHALRVTADGWPGHPLYLPGDLRPVPWSCP